MSGSSSRYTTYEWLWRNGRLGNQLWQIASTAGIAAANGTEPRFPIWEYQPYFRVPAEFFVQKLPTPRQDLGTDYLQELRHFAGIAERVRDWFQPSEKAEAVVRERLDELDLRGHLTAVHVRRGDYLYHPDHFPALGDRYYARAMAEVRRDHPGTTFVVFSDDPAWCRAKFRDGCRVIDGVSRPVEMVDRIGEPEDHWDLFLMSMACERHIIANSTFSWWGAWLSDDPAPIYPGRWFGKALGQIPWRAMFDGRWQEIPC